MPIEIRFEPQPIFNSRIKNNYSDAIHFEDYLILKSEGEIENALLDHESIEKADTLILTSNGCSRLNSHVFEKIPDLLVKFLNDFKNIIINNPPRLLLDSMKSIESVEVIYKTPFTYESISKEEIIGVWERFDENIVGQKIAKRAILRALVKKQWRKTNKKPLVLMFYGKPGIGKTETAKFLSKIIYKGDMIREQMSMASTENSINYFKSTKHTETSFSKTLMNRTSNLILLDEFALAHPVILTAFFQLFDEGIYTDSNYTVNMENSIIICTSNLLSLDEMHKEIDEALLSRFDAFIPFKPFTEIEKKDILSRIFNELKTDIKDEYSNEFDWDKIELELISKIDKLTNMRNIRNYIEDYLSDEILDIYINEQCEKNCNI